MRFLHTQLRLTCPPSLCAIKVSITAKSATASVSALGV